jgi:hypothetical protein
MKPVIRSTGESLGSRSSMQHESGDAKQQVIEHLAVLIVRAHRRSQGDLKDRSRSENKIKPPSESV